MDFKTEIWNDHCQVSLINASKYFIQYFILSNFYNALTTDAPLSGIKTNLRQRSAPLQSLMQSLYLIYGGYFLQEELSTFYETMTDSQIAFFFKQRRIEALNEIFKQNVQQVA